MGSLYSFGYNPFEDYLIQLLIHDVDVSDEKMKPEIHNAFVYILQNIMNNERELIFLDFEIVKTNKYYKILGKNAISALWLSGIFPLDVVQYVEENEFNIGDKLFEYNSETHELQLKKQRK
jgi:hypothetical protein